MKVSVGVRDWDKKLEVLFSVFGVSTPFYLAAKILKATAKMLAEDDDLNKAVENMANNINKWKSEVSSPKAGGDKFKEGLYSLLKDKGYEESKENISYVIFNGSIDEFKNVFKITSHIGINGDLHTETQNQLSRETQTGQSIVEGKNHHQMWIPRYPSPVTAKHVLDNNRRIDQKYHYLSPESEEIWMSLISNRGYKQFDECLFALEALFTDSKGSMLWHKFFTEDGANSVIMLGGGSAPKDVLIITETIKLLPSSDILNYILVDYSPYMLKSSLYKIDKELTQQDIATRVNLDIIKRDFLKLEGVFCRSDKNFAWIMPGGTIGNIDEGNFLESVASEAMPGDLLIIGAGTIKSDNTSMDDEALKKKYKSPELTRLLETPLRSVWHELKCTRKTDSGEVIPEALESALERIDTDLVSWPESKKYSDVPNSKTVEFSLDVDGRKIVLGTSTRYVEESFIEFAKIKGFKYEISVESPINKQYKQFVFRYDPSPV